MKLFTSKKVLFCILSVGSIVLAQTVKDFRSHTVRLPDREVIEKEYIPPERSVASEAVARAAQMWLPVNDVNDDKVNTLWEITRIVGSDELVVFDKFANPADAKKMFKVRMELIKNGVVQINKDEGQIYQVSLLSDFGTIALYKKLGNGYEILEARKVVTTNSSLVVSDEVELVLERALNQSKSAKVLEGDDVAGQVVLSAKKMTGLSVELKNSNGETQSIDIGATDLLDGGSFSTEVNGEEVSGVVLNNGKDGYRISFVTGPIAGAMLNFVTKEQLDKLQEMQADNAYNNAEVATVENPTVENTAMASPPPPESIPPESDPDNNNVIENNSENQEISSVPIPDESQQEATERVIEERRDVASDPESYQPVRVLSADEIKNTAEQNGFSF
jgi:hypothetical protein